MIYHLVNVDIAMDNQHFQLVNQLWIMCNWNNSYMLKYQRVAVDHLWLLPSGKRLHKTMESSIRNTHNISMAIFNSYVTNRQRVVVWDILFWAAQSMEYIKCWTLWWISFWLNQSIQQLVQAICVAEDLLHW